MGDPTPEERLAAIEALMGERNKHSEKWRRKADVKLDQLLKNSTGYITTDLLRDSITAHAKSCTKVGNPGSNGKVDMLLKGYRGLGIFGSMLVIIAGLLVAVLKLVGVF